MRKKYLSALLFGALLFASTGTFTSCKDYDDDIKNLQEQIDSQKTDLESKVTAMETTVNNLQSAQTSLESEIASVKSDAEAAALAAQNTAIETAKAELEAAKAELQAAIEAGASASEEAIKEAAAAAEEVMAEVSGRVDALESFQTTTEEALKNLQAANETLLTNITTLETEVANQLKEQGQRLTALEAQVAALEEYKASDEVATKGNAAQIEQILKDLENLQAGELTDEMIDKISAQITEEISDKLTLLSDALGKKVTHVSLVMGNDEISGYKALKLVSAEAVRTWTFGENFPGAISFTKGDKETFEDCFYLRVSPVNANLTLDNIKLVNSELKDLKGLVDIKSIEPYKELLTSRAVSENGLWKVTVKLVDNYDEEAYKEAATTFDKDGNPDKDILYAVMVGDSQTDERQVVSEYGLTLSQDDKKLESTLQYKVGDTNVDKILNRWDGDGSTPTENGGTVTYEEKGWIPSMNIDNEIVNAPYAEPIWEDDDINVQVDEGDARRDHEAFGVKAGEPFTVSLLEEVNDKAYAANIRGFYVTLDEACAVESAPSELNAWKSYNIQGLNTVTEESSIELTVPAIANGDYIGFRVYAVNYDGSLVDPDGRAFYVYVGEVAETAANLTLVSDAEVPNKVTLMKSSAKDDFSAINWGRADYLDYTITDAEGNDVTEKLKDIINLSNVVFYDKDGKEINVQSSEDKIQGEDFELVINNGLAAISGTTAVGLANVDVDNNPAHAYSLIDGMTYKMTIVARNSTSGIVARGEINFTKQLPAFPSSIYAYTGQIVNGNLKVYPEAANNKANAVYDMPSSFHGLTANDQTGVQTLANITIEEVADPGKNTLTYNTANSQLSSAAALVKPGSDNFGKKFPMNITYDWGTISYKWNNNTKAYEWGNHKPSYSPAFTVEFGNYVYDCEFSMSTISINYPGAEGQTTYFKVNTITVEDWYGAKIELTKIGGTDTNSKEVRYFDVIEEAAEGRDAVPFKVEFLTGANFDRVDEYFTFAGIENYNFGTAQKPDNVKAFKIVANKSVSATGEPVETKIRLTFKDKFGNEIEHVVDGSFMMNFQQ